jgi:type I restriction enzyme S subunit
MKYRYRTDDEMKDSGVEWLGKIPKEWEKTKIKYVSDSKKFAIVDGPFGTQLKADEYIEEGVPLIRITNLSYEGKLSDKNLVYIREAKAFELKRSSIVIGDIVIGKTGATIGKTGLNLNHNFAIIASSCLKLSPNLKNNRSEFVSYFIQSKIFQKNLLETSNGSTRDTINIEPFKNIEALKISYQEQQKIASFLDKKTAEFDNIIEKKQSLITKLAEAKKSLISEVVTGKKEVIFDNGHFTIRDRTDDEMKESGVEWLGKIPKEWVVSKLRYLGFTKNGISAGSEYFGSGYPFVSYSDVYNSIELPQQVKGLAKSTIEDQRNYSIQEGDVLFTRTSETIEEVGFASTCMRTIEKSTFAGFLIRFRPIKNKILKGFSKYYFSSSIHRSYFVKNMNLVTRASLSQELLKGLYIILPSLHEQKQIVDFLDEKTTKIDSTIEKIKLQIEKLKEAKQSLISEAVTGKIEVLD